jgi:hypothetical protein
MIIARSLARPGLASYQAGMTTRSGSMASMSTTPSASVRRLPPPPSTSTGPENVSRPWVARSGSVMSTSTLPSSRAAARLTRLPSGLMSTATAPRRLSAVTTER